MRFAIAALAVAVALVATPARAESGGCVSRDPAEWESGPDAYLLWTHPRAAAAGGFAYDEPDLICRSHAHRRHTSRHVWRRHRVHVQRVYARPSWVNVPIENRGGLCPDGN